MNKLYLFDSFALIFRAYFAFQKAPLINSKGFNVSAIQGFLNTLWEIKTKYNPSHYAIVFDAAAQTDRQAEHEFYKANRQETPDDIVASIPYIKEIVKAMNMPVVEIAGYEADDLIGTLAVKAAAQGFECYIVSHDKDLGQVVADNIFLHKPPFMGKPAEIVGVQELIKKWEIKEPKQIIDILGLWGDAVDNIPGVKGIGEKGAKMLIRQFGSIENIYENIDEVKGAMKEKLIEHKEMALISKKLATIITDAPIDWNENDFQLKAFNKEKLAQLFSELEFRTLGKKMIGDDYSANDSIKNITNPKTETPKNTAQTSMFASEELDAISTMPPTQKLQATSFGKNINNTTHHYTLIENDAQLQALMQQLNTATHICFDTETTSVDANNCELVGISFSIKPTEAYYIPIDADRTSAIAQLQHIKPILENDKIIKIGQNIKYDQLVLKWYDIEVKGVLFDTMLAHYLIDADTKHNMNVLAENYLGYTPVSIEELIGKKGPKQGTMRDVPLEKIKEYAAEDADITLQLHNVFKKEIENSHLHKLFYEVETPLIPVLTDMEFEGVKIDIPFLKAYSNEIGADIVKLKDEILNICGVQFNIDSPKQLGDILFEKMGIKYPGKKTKTGQYSTDEETLQKIASEHPIAAQLLDYRELTKLKSTYVDALPSLLNAKTNRIHTTFNQAIAATGRLSSVNPNLQNIPIRTERGRKIRQAFIHKDENHVLLSADYSQIELRIVASISEDANMIDAFAKNLDIHAATAANVFNVPLEAVTSEMRRQAKMVNFGIIYGISAFGLAQRLGIPRTEAAQLIEQYFEKYAGIKNYMDSTIHNARKNGYVETLLGRRRYLRDINAGNFTIRGFAERNAINAPIQGSAADMIKIAMINIHKQLKAHKFQSKMILQVHDELLFDVFLPEKQEIQHIVIREMQNALPLQVPIEVSTGYGDNWLEAH
ncbi:MAG TPA: DNA polymerase I [Chitinophagales bacterium]|nr:DNA polymerase I [Chitinophagales bacterium]